LDKLFTEKEWEGVDVILLKKETEGEKKYVRIGPFRIPYRTERETLKREVFIGPLHFRYWIDAGDGLVWFKLFGIRIKFRTREKGRKLRNYQIKNELTYEKRKELLQEEMAKTLGYVPNLDEPRTYNEKILWTKLNIEDPLITTCCDKYAVKEYVDRVIGPGLALPVIKAWEDPTKVDFDMLPDKFVLKVNWSSGYNIIVRDKSQLDEAETIQQLIEWMKPHRNSFYDAFNWGYKNMKPIAYAEPYIEQIDGQVYDYKFFISDGKLIYTLIATDRGNNLTKDFFDENFNHLPVHSGNSPHADPLPSKPKNYDRMLEIAKKLAEPFAYVRVDFYEVGDTIYLGEMTFYPGGGRLEVTPHEWEYIWGDKIVLPKRD